MLRKKRKINKIINPKSIKIFSSTLFKYNVKQRNPTPISKSNILKEIKLLNFSFSY